MNSFEFETVKSDVYRIIVKNSDLEITDVFERQDPRDIRIAKIALFAFVSRNRLSFDNKNIDRFLFCN